jgi:predicted AAA+ superfamily ATPase
LSKNKSDAKNYIFIDEIQEVAEFEKTIRLLVLDQNNDIYITGSSANLLSSELATLLSGRFIEFRIYDLSYLEFLRFHKLKSSFENYKLFSKYGGLPYLINLSLTDEIAFEYLKSIYSTIIFRDVVSQYNLRDSNFLEKLTRFLADNIGSFFLRKVSANT